MKEKKSSKTKEEVLSQEYLSASDMQIIIPTWSYQTALKYINDTRKKMEGKYYIPPGKTKLALKWMIVKDLGIKIKKGYASESVM